MRIVCDMDDVLASLVDPFLRFENSQYGTSFTREDIKTYDFWEHIGCTKEEGVEKLDRFFATPAFANLPVVGGAIKGVGALSDHELYIVTSRPKYTADVTRDWAERKFPNTFSDIKFSQTWTNPEANKGKSGLCKSLGAELIVEDCLAYASECAEKGIRAVLLDNPWNQGEELNGVIRVYSWAEAVSVING